MTFEKNKKKKKIKVYREQSEAQKEMYNRSFVK